MNHPVYPQKWMIIDSVKNYNLIAHTKQTAFAVETPKKTQYIILIIQYSVKSKRKSEKIGKEWVFKNVIDEIYRMYIPAFFKSEHA